MKTILSILLAAVMLFSVLSGCARDMSGETRVTPTAAATATSKPTNTDGAVTGTSKPGATTPATTDNHDASDGVIKEGQDAVDGVVGAGEDAVDDVVDAGEDIMDGVADAGEDIMDGVTGRSETQKPEATKKP